MARKAANLIMEMDGPPTRMLSPGRETENLFGVALCEMYGVVHVLLIFPEYML